MTDQHRPIWATCPACGKRAYTTHKDARRIARRLTPDGGRRVHAYECHDVPGSWHVGHIPRRLQEGRITRKDLR